MQTEIDRIIERILSGKLLENDAQRLLEMAQPYAHCILGCTELSLLNETYPMGNRMIDPLKKLAANLCSRAFMP